MLRVRVPATSANLGPGFDFVGMALDLYNEFIFSDDSGEQIEPGFTLLAPQSLCHQAVALLARTVKKDAPRMRIAIRAKVPRARGLGSSATLTVAGMVAANLFLPAGLAEEEIINLATAIEGHPDNVAPALVGGLVVCMKTAGGIKYLKTMPKKPLQVVVAVPEFELATSEARKVLPGEVPHQDAVYNTGRFGYFMASILTGDYSQLAVAMEDLLHQPYRRHLVPGLNEVMQSALAAGALGSCLSGAGPSILALCDRHVNQVSERMKEAWANFGIKADTYILAVASRGAIYDFV